MSKPDLERRAIMCQTEAQFAADVARIKVQRQRPGAVEYQRSAARWADIARRTLLTLMGGNLND